LLCASNKVFVYLTLCTWACSWPRFDYFVTTCSSASGESLYSSHKVMKINYLCDDWHNYS
jgi:hypothetical protein